MTTDDPPVGSRAGTSEPPPAAADSGPFFLRMLEGEHPEHVVVHDAHVFEWSDELAREAGIRLEEVIPTAFRRGAEFERSLDLLTKRYLLDARRVARMWVERGDPRSADAFRDFALDNARPLAETRCRSDIVATRLIVLVGVLVLVLGLVVPSIVEALGGGAVLQWLPLLIACGVNVLVSLFVAILPGRTGGGSGRTLTWGLAALSAVGVGFGSVVLDGTYAAIVVSVGADILVLLAGGSAFTWALNRSRVQKAFEGDPRTILIFDLVSLVHSAEHSRSDTERILRAIERVADRSAYNFTRIGVGRGPHVRAHAVHRAQGVRAVLLRHQVVLLDLRERGIDGLVQSLFNGIRAVFADDWAAFLVVEPESVNRSLLRRYGPQTVLAGGLLAVATVLPSVVPSLVTNTDQFRATLIITAVFALIAPDVQKTADAVRNSFKGS